MGAGNAPFLCPTKHVLLRRSSLEIHAFKYLLDNFFFFLVFVQADLELSL